jgi:hypothetical protein
MDSRPKFDGQHKVQACGRQPYVLQDRLRLLIVGTRLEDAARGAARVYRRFSGRTRSPVEARNAEYDDWTLEIAERVLSGHGLCIDSGAHTGELLQRFRAVSPSSSYLAIKPIPELAERRRRRFPGVDVRAVALADFAGETEFRHLLHSARESSMYNAPSARPTDWSGPSRFR